jgi:hypothetical protein
VSVTVTVVGCDATVVVDVLRVRVVPIVPGITSIGTVALFPPEVAVTVAVPPAPAVGVTVMLDPVVALSVISAPVVSEVVQVTATSELLPLTSVPLAEIVRVPASVAELRTAVVGLTVMLASEFGETKKPLQPISNPATAIRLIRARTAVPL